MFYDLQTTLDENMFLSFVTSQRGLGKTFGSLKRLIERFIETGEQFVYVRRSQTEIDLALPTMFDPFAKEGFFLDHELRVKGDFFYCDNKVMGRGLAISTAYKFKSVGFPLVSTILFDEFISENNKYLKDEITKFLSIIETIGRMREINVVCLANQNTIYNPYYLYFGIRPASRDTPKTRFRSKSIMIQQFTSQEFNDKKVETRFGKLINGTTYGDFLLNNKNISDNYLYVDKLKGVRKNPYFCFTLEGKDVAVFEAGEFFYLEARPPIEGVPTFNFDRQLMAERTMDKINKNTYIKMLRYNLSRGWCRFSDVPVKTLVEEFIS